MRLRTKFLAVIVCTLGVCAALLSGKWQAPPDTSAVLWVDLQSPSTARRELALWRWQANASQRCAPELELLELFDENTPVERDARFPRGWHELQYTRVQLYTMQACAYAALARWAQLAEALDIQRWSLQAGSLVGQVCYESMVPWDDDIDVVVFGYECQKLERLFEGLPPAPEQPDMRFHAKTLDSEFDMFRIQPVLAALLYYTSAVFEQTAVETRFKLRSQLQPNRGDILGLDIECRSMPPGGISSNHARDVRFGPTTARVLQLDDMSVLWPHQRIGC